MENRTPIVEALKLKKVFNNKTVVDEIDFTIFTGEIVGFLGPNGAGKTTTIRMLTNILNPNSGELRIFGKTYQHNRNEILSQMNASSGTLTLPGKLTVRENLSVFADMYAISNKHQRISSLIEKFNLNAYAKTPVYALSTGQQVRVSMAKAFLNKPRLLLLDEPTSSLDPDVADRVRSFLVNIVKEEGTTVFLTSHNMTEVEMICSRVLFLNEGRIQAEGSPRELTDRTKRWTLTLSITPSTLSVSDLPHFEKINATLNAGQLIVEIDRALVGPFLTDLALKGIRIQTLSIHKPTLEDFFVTSARKGDTSK